MKHASILALIVLACTPNSGIPPAQSSHHGGVTSTCSLVFICEKVHENVRVQRCLEAGPGFRYEYDLFTFTDPEVAYVARSYVSEPDEAHILRKEIEGEPRFVSANDLSTEPLLEFEAYLREHGKTNLSYLSTEAEGYVEISR